MNARVLKRKGTEKDILVIATKAMKLSQKQTDKKPGDITLYKIF
jgi:hypothetical protein